MYFDFFGLESQKKRCQAGHAIIINEGFATVMSGKFGNSICGTTAKEQRLIHSIVEVMEFVIMSLLKDGRMYLRWTVRDFMNASMWYQNKCLPQHMKSMVFNSKCIR